MTTATGTIEQGAQSAQPVERPIVLCSIEQSTQQRMHANMQQATALLAAVAATPLLGLDDETVCALMANAEQAGRYLDAIRALAAAEVDERSRYELGNDGLAFRLGHRRGLHLVEQVTRVSQTEAARRIRIGSAIRPRLAFDGEILPAAYPRVAGAMTSGTMGADGAAHVIRCLDQAARGHATTAALAAAEDALVDASRHESADIIALQARVWREALDPDGAEPRAEALRGRRRFSLGREVGGLTPFSGACDPLSAAFLRAAFTESSAPGAQPRFLSDDDRAAGTETVRTADGDIVETIRDPRTREQRQLDVLLGLVSAGMRVGEQPGSMRSLVTVMATVRLSDLESGRGVGWLDDVDEPVSAAMVQELACDNGYRQVVLGDNGEVLNVGRLERFFTPAQRRALAVRDGGCVWPQCTAPPSWCHAHHVEEWNPATKSGLTNLDNGVLLCAAHHHMLHASPFTMKMIRGRPKLLAPPWLDPGQVWRPLGRSRVTMVAAHESALSRG